MNAGIMRRWLPARRPPWQPVCRGLYQAVTDAGVAAVAARVGGELVQVQAQIRRALGAEYTPMVHASGYYFGLGGKLIRPRTALHMAQVTNAAQAAPVSGTAQQEVRSKQIQLAAIAEMIHTASLKHDDVVDCSLERRGQPSTNLIYGNRNAILSGTFVISRASAMLAQLDNTEVLQIMSGILEDLVQGELLQLKPSSNPEDWFTEYMQKTFLKTASLFAKTCKATAVLSGCSEEQVEGAFQFGKHLGLAFQLVDDVLDLTATPEMLGKPTSTDLTLGLATAPVLFAREEYPELQRLITRQFQNQDDVRQARVLVEQSNGIARTNALIEKHSRLSMEALEPFRASNERAAILSVVDTAMRRRR